MFVPTFNPTFASLASRIDDLESGSRQPGIEAVNVQAQGAVGDGETDDRAAIQTAIDSADASGVTLYLPPGVYRVNRNGSLGQSVFMSGKKNLRIVGVRGRTWLRHPTGMLNASVPILRLDDCENVTIDGVGFDGNWGNAATSISHASDEMVLPQSTIHVLSTWGFPDSGSFLLITPTGSQTISYTGKTDTAFTGCSGGTGTLHLGQTVGYLDARTGINHESQVDPKSHGIMIRGGNNITIRDCVLRNVYGDAIWVGASTLNNNSFVTGARNIRILDCDTDMTARSGIAFGQRCSDIVVRGCRFVNTFATPVDTEPVEQGIYNVVIDSCYLSAWWNPGNPARSGNLAMSISGGKVLSPSPGNYAQNYRVVNNTIRGGIFISTAKDIVVSNNRIICDWKGYGYAPIGMAMYCDGIQIDGNYIYDSVAAESDAFRYHDAAIQANVYAATSFNGQPAGISIRNNVIKVRNGRAGIRLYGTGSYAVAGALLPSSTGVATDVTATTLTCAGAEWTPNQFSGYRVRIGAATAIVVFNTADTLELWVEISHKTAWRLPTGEMTDTPEPGEFLMFQEAGIAEVSNNHIDCTDDGNGAGANGISLYAYRAGMRAVVRGNMIRNANGDAIHIRFADAARKILSLELADNKAWDDQIVSTCSSAIHFQPPVHVQKLIMRNNQAGDGVQSTVTGLTSGTWLVNDGPTQQWSGYGPPEGAVAAPVGSSYTRVDGSAGNTFYVKESGTGTSGWSNK